MSKKNMKQYDGFQNLLKSFGGKNDTRTQTTYGYTPRISLLYRLLEDLYATSWVAAKVIDIPVDDAFREGRTLDIEDTNKRKEIEELYKYLDKQIKKAIKFARLYGGSYLVLVSTDDSLEKPVEQLSQGDLVNLAVLDPTQVSVGTLNLNPLSKDYLKPESFTIYNTTQQVHPSRIYYVDGVDTTYEERQRNRGYGTSLYERGYKNIEDAVQTTVGIRNLVEQSNIDVISMKDLNSTVASNSEDAVKDRISILSQMKSMLNTIAIDAEDTYTNIAKNFGTLDKIQMNFYTIVAGCFDIPVTRLLGKSPDGMNATGESDLKNYYDKVKADVQIGSIEEIYKWLDPIVNTHLFGSDEVIIYEFNPLFQKTEKEEAELLNTNTTAFTALADRDIVSDNDIIKEFQKMGYFKDVKIEEFIGGE